MKKIIAALITIIAGTSSLQAQRTGEYKPDVSLATDTSEMKILVSTPKRFYMGNGYDFLMLSSSIYERPGKDGLTGPRFTAVVNLGLNFHFDANKNFGLFSGISLKNLGLIDRTGTNRVKYRVYTIGVPLGIKVGNLRNRNFVFAGGGIDMPFHYKEKEFTNRFNKDHKRGEWFSDATPKILPYVFLGLSVDPGFIIKAQYYPTNFFNQDYEIVSDLGVVTRPFANTTANIFALSVSIDIHYNQYKIQEREYRKWKAELNAQKDKN